MLRPGGFPPGGGGIAPGRPGIGGGPAPRPPGIGGIPIGGGATADDGGLAGG